LKATEGRAGKPRPNENVGLRPTRLIYLAKVGLVDLIEAIPTKKLAARSVLREFVEQGKAKGSADALALAHLFETNTVSIVDPSGTALRSTLRRISGLEEPGIDTLAIAKERDYTAVLDDLFARKVARTCGIKLIGTPHILILGIQNHALTKQDAVRAVDDMIETDWRCGPEIYRRIVQLIHES